MIQQKRLEKRLYAYFYGVRVDINNPEAEFIISPKTRKYIQSLRNTYPIPLEIRVRNIDLNSLFAFRVDNEGYILENNNVVTVRNPINPKKILYYSYSLPIYIIWSKKRDFSWKEINKKIYIFVFLPNSNKYKIYKAEVIFINEIQGKLSWEKICCGSCYQKDGEAITDFQKWPPLANLFKDMDFLRKFRPYFFKEMPHWKKPLLIKEKPPSQVQV